MVKSKCIKCKELKEIQGYGMCSACYQRNYKKRKLEGNIHIKICKVCQMEFNNEGRCSRRLTCSEGCWKNMEAMRKRNHYLDNKKVYNKRAQEWNKRREYLQRPEVKIKKRIYNREYSKKRMKQPSVKLSHAISTGIYGTIKQNKSRTHWEKIVDFNLKDLKKHLEKQFNNGMDWDNYGSYWQIDHRIPVSWFNFKSYEDEEFKQCWALENLQPMIAKLNNSKNNRFAEPTLKQIGVSIGS